MPGHPPRRVRDQSNGDGSRPPCASTSSATWCSTSGTWSAHAGSSATCSGGTRSAGKSPLPVPAAAFSSGRTHHELLLIEVGANAAAMPPGRRVGLYHFGLKVGDSDEELREVMRHLTDRGVQIQGASDHTVTHSLYIADPDGHEIELYVDATRAEEWLADPSLIFAPIRPLRPDPDPGQSGARPSMVAVRSACCDPPSDVGAMSSVAVTSRS